MTFVDVVTEYRGTDGGFGSGVPRHAHRDLPTGDRWVGPPSCPASGTASKSARRTSRSPTPSDRDRFRPLPGRVGRHEPDPPRHRLRPAGGLPGAVRRRMLAAGILGTYTTDWLGAENVRRLKVQFRGSRPGRATSSPTPPRWWPSVRRRRAPGRPRTGRHPPDRGPPPQGLGDVRRPGPVARPAAGLLAPAEKGRPGAWAGPAGAPYGPAAPGSKEVSKEGVGRQGPGRPEEAQRPDVSNQWAKGERCESVLRRGPGSGGGAPARRVRRRPLSPAARAAWRPPGPRPPRRRRAPS